jgi:hypothetical protein
MLIFAAKIQNLSVINTNNKKLFFDAVALQFK